MRRICQFTSTPARHAIGYLLMVLVSTCAYAQDAPRSSLEFNAPQDRRSDNSEPSAIPQAAIHPHSQPTELADPPATQRLPAPHQDPLIERRDRAVPILAALPSLLEQISMRSESNLAGEAYQLESVDTVERYPLRQLTEERPWSSQEVTAAHAGNAIRYQFGNEANDANQLRVRSMSPLDWWQPTMNQPVFANNRWLRFDLQTLISDALRNSPDILAVGYEVETAYADIVQQAAAFDARLILDSKYRATSDPVGNTLQTGGPPRLRESDWASHVGLRRNTRLGGQFDVAQELGTFNSNSVFLNPTSQGTTRLVVSLNQPLLAGAGRLYNERLILSAQFNADATWNETRGEIQAQLAEVMNAYWQLYLERSRLVLQQDLLKRGQYIETLVVNRSDFDTGKIEILRVQEQIARRRDRLIRIETDLRNQQSRLARLVGAPQLVQSTSDEFIPETHPVCPDADIDLDQAIVTGLHHRADVAVATTELELAALDVQVTRNQLLPQLNALMETYVAGLNGNYDVGQSFTDQFTQGQPGVTAGLEFNLPIGRRAAKAKHVAANLQLQRHSQRLRQAVLTARAEIEVAVREIDLARASLNVRQQTLNAAAEEETYLLRRWEMLGGDGTSVGLVLQDLLDAQQRRTEAEMGLVSAQVQYLQALVNLEAAMGTLLMAHPTLDPDSHAGELQEDETEPLEVMSQLR